MATARIFKNTFLLYFRMILIMAVSLYTVRMILKILGIIDYGIFNVVAGFVTMLGFLSQAMAASTQRFFSFVMSQGIPTLNSYFNNSILIYVGFILIVLLLGETLGLWFLNCKMEIPPDRLRAANYLYQFSILTFIFTIITVPYNSLIVSYENMSVYVVVGFVEALLKLGSVLILLIFPGDKLIFYSVFLFISSLIVAVYYAVYCNIKYRAARFKFSFDKKIIKSLLSFSSWTTFNSLAAMGNNQGNNVLINLFFGPAVNASRGIAFQIFSAMFSFSVNFFLVVRPQIIKSYADRRYDYMWDLFHKSSYLIFALMFVLCFPLIADAKFVLSVWLGNSYNEQMVLFTQLVLIYSIIVALNNPITCLVHATGKVKRYHLFIESITLLCLPITYILFKLGYNADYSFYTSIFVYFVAHIVRLFFLKELFPEFSIGKFLSKFLLYCSLIVIINIILNSEINRYLAEGWIRLFVLFLVSAMITAVITFFMGLDSGDRKKVFSLLKLKKKTR